jgi:CMP-N-acetylneuraminic acid synthetase
MTYEEKGGIYALDVNNLKKDSFLGERISFISVDEVESIRIDSDLNYWIADRILREDYCQ